ncbi:hypothetical protein [Acinetobacter sp. G11]|uniref:hypothetical protein n=1 Tax=Acinetobacter sp. G11 TaxID=3415989 RepID=UPI003C7BC6C3
MKEKIDIYLDHNVMCDYFSRKEENIINKVKILKKKVEFSYSPAHIEEIANIKKSNLSSEEIMDLITHNIDGIIEITDYYEYLPGEKIFSKLEDPWLCLYRVLKDYDKTTTYAEFLHQKLFQERFEVREKYIIENIGNINPHDLFENTNVKNALLAFCKNDTDEIIKLKDHNNLHKKLLYSIDNLICFLELIGFYSDRLNQYRSNLHDISHLIYASKADYFVSGDKKTRYKATAIYSFLNIQTNVIDKDEFVNLKI